jgi:hypothetical protein
LVEQMTVNHWVAGSSPAGGAIQMKGLPKGRPFLVFGKVKSATVSLK